MPLRTRCRRIALFLCAITEAVTLIFYFVLAAFHTKNIQPSTISVTTSFLAVYLTFRRSPFYAVGYAANDIVRIVLWALAAAETPAYFSVVDLCRVLRERRLRVRQLAQNGETTSGNRMIGFAFAPREKAFLKKH